MADVIDVEEAGLLDCFVTAGAELQRTQVAPEPDAFTFSEIACHDGVSGCSASSPSARSKNFSSIIFLSDLRAAALSSGSICGRNCLASVVKSLPCLLVSFS